MTSCVLHIRLLMRNLVLLVVSGTPPVYMATMYAQNSLIAYDWFLLGTELACSSPSCITETAVCVERGLCIRGQQ